MRLPIYNMIERIEKLEKEANELKKEIDNSYSRLSLLKNKHSIKPDYLFIYKHDEAVDKLMKHHPFSYNDPIKVERQSDGVFIEYEHINVRCIKKNSVTEHMRGFKTWQVLVEDCLYDELTNRQIECILLPMMTFADICGGRIVRI